MQRKAVWLTLALVNSSAELPRGNLVTPASFALDGDIAGRPGGRGSPAEKGTSPGHSGLLLAPVEGVGSECLLPRQAQSEGSHAGSRLTGGVCLCRGARTLGAPGPRCSA